MFSLNNYIMANIIFERDLKFIKKCNQLLFNSK